MLQFISRQPRFGSLTILVPALTLLASACAEAPALPTSPAPRPTAAPPTAEAAVRVVVLGDSLAAGLGLAASEAFPAVLETLLHTRGFDIEIVNAGVSGDTTAGGRSRLDWVLQEPTEVLVIELGGNDALRGQPLENTEANLRELIRRGRTAGAEVVLLGMDVPTNYGPDYADSFAGLYPRVAEEEGATLVPGFVRVLAEDPSLLQPDGLHPTADGQRVLAEKILPVVVDVLESP